MPWVKVTKEDKLALTEHIKSINEILSKYHNNLPNWVLSIGIILPSLQNSCYVPTEEILPHIEDEDE